jgi:uncharacterized protein with GYD domain
MPHYLVQVTYTPEAWATQLKNPQSRIDAIRPSIERLGGKIECAYMTFGEYDLMIVLDMPDNVSAAALSIAAAAGGAVKAIKTTPLMTIAEGIEAMRKGAAAGYRGPG